MKTALNNYFSNAKNLFFLQRIFLIFTLSFTFFNLPCSASAQTTDPLIQKLDSRYYYPSRLGLNKLTVKVKWLEQDLSSTQFNFISHPGMMFTWNKHSGERRFQIDPRLKDLSKSRKEEIESFFRNYQEVILPRSLNETLSGFKFNGTQKFPSQTIAEYHSMRNQDQIQKFILNINPEHWRISKFNIERKRPPHRVASYFKYIKKEGKWLVSETVSQFDLGRDSYSETTRYTYQKIKGYWLPTKVNQILKKGRDVAHSYRFLLNDYRIN